jgi:hypothetical protein
VKPPDQPRRPPKRAFSGLAGRESPADAAESAEAVAADETSKPLAEIIPFPEAQQPQPASAPKRGRPRKHADNASKQKKYRERRNSIAIIGERVANQTQVSTDNTLTMKWFIPGAGHGKGLMITGGYDKKKINEVRAAADRAEKGRRVHPKGYGSDEDGDRRGEKQESENTFTCKIRFPKNDALTDYEKQEILDDLARVNTSEEPCEELAGVDKKDLDKYRVVRCDLCAAIIGVSYWGPSWEHFRAEHFMKEHPKFVWKTWRDATPKPPLKPTKRSQACREDHIGAAKRLGEERTLDRVHCRKCRKLIYDPTNPRSPYFRNTQIKNNNPNEIKDLTSKVNSNPIRGEIHTSPSASQLEPQGIVDTQDILNKEVA